MRRVQLKKTVEEGSGAVRTSTELDVLGSGVPNKPTVSVDVKQHFNNNNRQWIQSVVQPVCLTVWPNSIY